MRWIKYAVAVSLGSAWFWHGSFSLALEGVGALADRLSPAASYTLTGRTAPWAEVVVVDPSDPGQTDRVWVLAELEPTGSFQFTFRVSPTIYSRLQIFAVDEVGTTNRVLLPDPPVEILLPPTIVNDEEDTSTDEVALTGFTYPNSQVTLTITNLDSDVSFGVNVDTESGGRWRYGSDGMEPGRYKAVAISRSGTLESQRSQEIFFEIPSVGLPPFISELLERLLEALPAALRIFIQQLFIQAPAISKVALPVAIITSGFFVTDLFAGLLKLILGLLHLLGFRRNRRSWGVVYSAATKQPLERVIVRLYDEATKRLVETDVTGSDGVFSFLPKAGRYTLKVNRSGFVFPSKLVRGSGSDGEYERLYHGEVLEVKQERVIAVSIPMDPSEARSTWAFRLRQVSRRLGTQLNWGILFIGVTFSTATMLRRLSLINIGVFAIYVGLLIYSLTVWRRKNTALGVVLDSQTGKPVEGVGINLYDTEFNRLVQRRVSDETGRFQLLVRPGTYRLDVSSLDWILDVSVPKAFKGELLVAPAGKRTLPLTPTVYVSRRN